MGVFGSACSRDGDGDGAGAGAGELAATRTMSLSVFTPSGPALGTVDEIPPSLRPAFDADGHAAAPADLPMDGESGQTYADYLDENPPRPSAGAATIALLPIGAYPNGFIVEEGAVRLVRSPSLALVSRFIEAWFGLPTRVLPAMSDTLLESMPSREHDGRRQLDARALLDWLRWQRPVDATCMLALTLEDLHDDTAQWLFGYASIDARVGVHSMLRYDPGFDDTHARGPGFRAVIKSRALRVVAHEVAHMFGLRHCLHCLHFRCIMNPIAGLEDLDALPLRLCPVCLRKLWSATGVPLASRWEALWGLGLEIGRPDERQWYADRLRRLERAR